MVTKTDTRFTRSDYLKLPEGFPAQLIDGSLVKEPAPTRWHQSVVGRIQHALTDLVGPLRVLASPVDVFVDEWNVLQPDVMVLAEEDRVHPEDTGEAIPFLVVEVLSPSTARRDREVKSGIYLRSGVREVWLVDPVAKTVEIRTPVASRQLSGAEPARSEVLDGFALDLRALFES